MNFKKRLGLTSLLLAGAVCLAGCSNHNNPMGPNANVSRGIYVMNADGTNQAQLAQGGKNPSWRGSKITFSSGSPSEIYVMNSDGSNQTKLTNVGGWLGADHPSFSPDGSKIAFINPMNDGTYNTEVYVMNSDGSNRSRLTNDAAWEFSPSWSPDGSKLAYNYGVGDLHVMNADGTNHTVLGWGYSPDWSPDGTRIAYGGAGGIFVMNADGSNPIPLTSDTTGVFDDEPAWSPDGSKIAFSRSTGAGGSTTYQIFVMNADGSNLNSPTSGTPGKCMSPCWSPDGSKIAFCRYD
jgi:Tol biopolymer transport system component